MEHWIGKGGKLLEEEEFKLQESAISRCRWMSEVIYHRTAPAVKWEAASEIGYNVWVGG